MAYYEACGSYCPEFREMGIKMIKAQRGWVSDTSRILAAQASPASS
jgi:hypothetical protein